MYIHLNHFHLFLSHPLFPPSLPPPHSLLHSNTAFRPVDRMQSQIQHVYAGDIAELESVIQPGRAKELYRIEWNHYNQRGNLSATISYTCHPTRWASPLH